MLHCIKHHVNCVFFVPILHRIMDAEIHCTSGYVDNPTSGPVLVFIDNTIVSMSGVAFEYRDDPVYSRASPQMIIPA